MKRRRTRLRHACRAVAAAAALALASTFMAGSAGAQEGSGADEGWRFSVTPYL